MMRLFALRGATQLQADSAQEMMEKVGTLADSLFKENSIDPSDVVSIHFTVTGDLHSMNPATAYRRWTNESKIPLFCSREPDIDGMMPRVVRVLMYLYKDDQSPSLKAQYHGNTRQLRPDIF
ncbi:MAG: chorismate mutase [Sphaerochaetaceae bacterium]|nr:chorismate mutase [Sphaerochaetaceae bacterium]